MKAGTSYDPIDRCKAPSKSDRAVLDGGVNTPAALILTDHSSDNKQPRKTLSKVHCKTTAFRFGRFPKNRFSGWPLPSLGQETLPTLFRHMNGDSEDDLFLIATY